MRVETLSKRLASAARRAQAHAVWLSSRVQCYGYDDGNIMSFGVRSFSRPDLIHTATINLSNGEAFCTCENAVYRKNRDRPTIHGDVCRHVWAVVRVSRGS